MPFSLTTMSAPLRLPVIGTTWTKPTANGGILSNIMRPLLFLFPGAIWLFGSGLAGIIGVAKLKGNDAPDTDIIFMTQSNFIFLFEAG